MGVSVPGGSGVILGGRKPAAPPTPTRMGQPGTGARDFPGQPGHGTPPAPVKPHWLQHPVKLQRMLTNKGYKVTIDGILGPQTRSAFRSFKSGVGANAWNRAYFHGLGDTPPPKNPPKNPPAAPPLHVSAPRSHGVGAPKVGSGKALARAMTNEQFGPILHQLHYQAALGDNQAQQNLANIADWYGQVGDAEKAAAAHTAANDAAEKAALQTQFGNLAAAFGGGANAGGQQMGGQADALTALLASGAADRAGFDNSMGAILAQQGAEAKTNEQRYGNQQSAAIQDKINQALQQRASAVITNRNTAQNQLTQRAAALQNMQILASETGLKNKSLAQQIRGQKLQNRADQITVQQLLKNKGKPANQRVTWAKVDKLSLQDHVTSQVVSAKGTFRVSPIVALRNIQASVNNVIPPRMRSNPQVTQFIERTWQQIWRNDQADPKSHWRGWSWHNGKLFDPRGRMVHTF